MHAFRVGDARPTVSSSIHTRPEVTRLLLELRALGAQRTGFRPEAIAEAALRHFIREALDVDDLAGLEARVRRRDPRLVHALTERIVPHPTYLNRHPEQFHYLHAAIRVGQVGGPGCHLRAWSAGCSTGEEAYSLSATLLEALSEVPDASFDVLGSDLLGSNIEVARRGRYGRGSTHRDGTPVSHIVEPGGYGKLRVIRRVARHTRFEEHNLLDAPPDGMFDVLFCRNVFMYLTPAAQRLAFHHMRERLAPGALVFFSPADPTDALSGLEALPLGVLRVFRMPSRSERPPPRRRPVAERPVRALQRPVDAAPDPQGAIDKHMEALLCLEGNDLDRAGRLLEEVAKAYPAYVPARVEHALLCHRRGLLCQARELMREAARETEALADDTVLPGPEALPVRYYRSVFASFLESC